MIYSNNLTGVAATGANLYFDNANALYLYFNIDESVSLASLRIFITKNGAPVKVLKGTELAKDEKGYYYKTDAIAATDFDELYTATVYVDDLMISTSVTYSVASYVAANYSAATELGALVQALWNYGVAATAYAAA
ncbi:MAG: hypothetical protein IJX81_02355 [Clostridia bacterium]|nr:hypothetical protein [Clostridia bacterium]